MSLTLSQAVVKRRGKRILGPVDLHLSTAEITIVLGPNGAGKTTLLRVLHGVERLSSGELALSKPDAQARQEQAYVFQSPIMLRRTVRANLAYPLELLGTARPIIKQKVEHWAERIGLADALERHAPRLSGGEKQKLALARALIRSPDVLFLDEPCANLDGRSTREIETLLKDAQLRGTQIVMTTHDLGQARRMASEVVFLLYGKVHERADAQAFFAKPDTQEAQAFLKGDIIE
ncbi:MAG: ATP-binding cassette domain-containing protein [Planktotalea sp.]|uniref:energy-coupling factor ABC transporter ATP-binding protein n=1 Tax=Planktotalea sp. TaxID=2029877 RepID=UPI002603DFD5|nr:ATP-binding cassette domain-containing protein [Planktotalea sp.]MDG1077730.1 ATP-binding cassette domain-containing protein [Planktotalea sp.]MDG1084220.1 ATP-binding cassette domain-containing protein [Planktotalea sp.]